MRLTIELVPQTAWWSNVRSNVSKSDWEKCKKYAKSKTDFISACFICGQSGLNQGRRYAVEAHEVWAYDDKNKIQTLVDIIPICPRCHQCKHLGRSRATMTMNEWSKLIAHFQEVNDSLPGYLVERYVLHVFDQWRERSEHEWKLDVSFLERELGFDLTDRVL